MYHVVLDTRGYASLVADITLWYCANNNTIAKSPFILAAVGKKYNISDATEAEHRRDPVSGFQVNPCGEHQHC
jgi:hypothetical protein